MRRAVIAGFVATVTMTLALAVGYFVALELGSPSVPSYAAQPGPPQWMWALTHNPITELTRGAMPAAFVLHLALGLIWAGIYAAVFEPRLPGADWQKGITFALIPYVLSLVVFLPLAGGGLFGLALGAGPLPILGNLILHIVYGVTLGELYGRLGDRVLTETGFARADEMATLARAERTAAYGIVIGAVLGAIVGVSGGRLFGGSGGPVGVTAGLLWGLVGGSVGALVGSLAGLDGRGPGGRAQDHRPRP
ncbi:MAG TPA: DUF6789 family protein [Thermodesulfobacteriota bacterium]